MDCYDFPIYENHGIFGLLTKWHGRIEEEDHIVEATSVVILDHPVEGEGGGVEELFRERKAREEDYDDEEPKPKDGGEGYRPTLVGFHHNHKNLKPPPENLPLFSRNPKSPPQVSTPRRTRASPMKKRATIGFSHSTLSLTHDTSISNLSAELDATSSSGGGDGADDEDDAFVTWTVLVRGMRLLWTIDIRDAVVLVVGDLLHTLELMSLQRKHEGGGLSTRSRNNSTIDDSTLGSDQGRTLVDFGDGLMLPAAAGIFMTGTSDDDDDDEEVRKRVFWKSAICSYGAARRKQRYFRTNLPPFF